MHRIEVDVINHDVDATVIRIVSMINEISENSIIMGSNFNDVDGKVVIEYVKNSELSI